MQVAAFITANDQLNHHQPNRFLLRLAITYCLLRLIQLSICNIKCCYIFSLAYLLILRYLFTRTILLNKHRQFWISFTCRTAVFGLNPADRSFKVRFSGLRKNKNCICCNRSLSILCTASRLVQSPETEVGL